MIVVMMTSSLVKVSALDFLRVWVCVCACESVIYSDL